MDRGASQDDPRSHGYSSQSSGHVAPNDRSPSAPSAPGPLYGTSSRISDETNLLRRNLMGQEPLREEPRHDYGAPRKEEYSSPLKTQFRGSYYSQPPPTSTVEAPRSHPQIIEALRRPPEQFTSQEPIPIHSRNTFESDRRRDETLMRRSESRDSRRMGGEDMQQSRSFLGISSDPNKRGRASPLPQAVKGAAPQLVGPGSDPSIKSEFGRIFQGLGSGLGGPGSLTPSRQSPVPQRMRDDAGHVSDNDGVKMTRIGSQGGRALGRRPREDGRPDVEDGRSTPVNVISGRASKRPRVSNIQTLSLQQDLEDITAIQDGAGKIIPIQPTANLLIPPPTLAKPVLSINSKPLLESIANLPRNHYGSCIYEQHATLPPKADAGPEDTYPQFLLPRRFTDNEIGGTFTVRVPRWYLTAEARKELVRDPYLFGTDVYTDDSNPLVAAMHGGWIRGAWASELDTTLMDLPPESDLGVSDLKDREFGSIPGSTDDAEGGVNPPAVPLTPPHGLDAHITLLVLPTLQRYARTLRFGVKSKEWVREIHDGLSFMVVGLKFVDEASRVGQDRTGKARRDRIRRELDMRDKRWKGRVEAVLPVKAS
jgi:Histone deacetylation protein Rxt3